MSQMKLSVSDRSLLTKSEVAAFSSWIAILSEGGYGIKIISHTDENPGETNGETEIQFEAIHTHLSD
jgi:hypothetical protein